MYKIYINETPLFLVTPADVKKFGPPSDVNLILRHSGKRKFMLNIVDQLEKSRRFDQVVLFSPELDKLWESFQEIFKRIDAAGGVVFNEKEEILAIYRRKIWDLPKGKIDPGETPESASIREVQEETGLSQIELGEHLHDTWHTYRTKKHRVLKKTYWYLMKTRESVLTPQIEEDIEMATWKPLAELTTLPSGEIYNSLRDVLAKAKNY